MFLGGLAGIGLLGVRLSLGNGVRLTGFTWGIRETKANSNLPEHMAQVNKGKMA